MGPPGLPVYSYIPFICHFLKVLAAKSKGGPIPEGICYIHVVLVNLDPGMWGVPGEQTAQ